MLFKFPINKGVFKAEYLQQLNNLYLQYFIIMLAALCGIATDIALFICFNFVFA